MVEVLEAKATSDAVRTAFTFEGRPWSYGELWGGIRKAARLLRDAGVEEGDNVAIALPNGSAFFEAFYGVQAVGAVAVPLFPRLGSRETLESAQRCDAVRLIVADERFEELVGMGGDAGATVSAPSVWGALPPAQAIEPADSGSVLLQTTIRSPSAFSRRRIER